MAVEEGNEGSDSSNPDGAVMASGDLREGRTVDASDGRSGSRSWHQGSVSSGVGAAGGSDTSDPNYRYPHERASQRGGHLDSSGNDSSLHSSQRSPSAQAHVQLSPGAPRSEAHAAANTPPVAPSVAAGGSAGGADGSGDDGVIGGGGLAGAASSPVSVGRRWDSAEESRAPDGAQQQQP
eukprot:Opistho-2@15723